MDPTSDEVVLRLLADTRSWAESLERDAQRRIGELDGMVREQERILGEAEANFGRMEKTVFEQRDHIAHLGAEVTRIQEDAETRIRMVEREREQRDRMLGQLDHVRRDLEARDRALRLQVARTGSVPRQKGRRKARKLFTLYPRVAWLFAVNLLTNFYMEKWQKKHGRQIFPGHVKAGG